MGDSNVFGLTLKDPIHQNTIYQRQKMDKTWNITNIYYYSIPFMHLDDCPYFDVFQKYLNSV